MGRKDRWTSLQRRFVKEYPLDHNGQAAAIRAGYSPNSAKNIAWELLNDERYQHVQEAIAEEEERINRRLEISAERIRAEQAKLAFANIRDFLMFGPEGVTLKKIDEIDPLELAAVAEVRETKDGVIFKLHPKQPALDALARMEGLYKDSMTLKSDGLLLRVAGVDEQELAELDEEDDA